MSASIYWKPRGDGLRVGVAAPSLFIERMTAVFGTYPWRLGQSDRVKLEVLAATNEDGASKNPYDALIEAIGTSAAGIEVWPEY